MPISQVAPPGKWGNIPAVALVCMVMKMGRAVAVRLVVVSLPLVLAIGLEARANGYEPLAVNAARRPAPLDLTVHDASRDRDIPLRVYLPPSAAPAPVILFSHGLGGSRASCAFLGDHWAARGYVAVFLQHPGSDDSVWQDEPARQRMQSLKQAASLENLLLRVKDVPAVLNQLERWNADKTNALGGRLDLERIGMSGHSFGAVTTEAVSGETLPVGGQKFTDPRIRAALVLSPSAPRGGDAATAFGAVTIPWMLMTGTKDLAPIGNADMKSRLAVYPALHGAPKYELVLHNAEHSVFTDRALPGDHEPRNPNHHRVILALSTAFWDAYLRGDAEALAWLNGSGPRSVMEPADQWQFLDH
jgi:predicted dienelactone hydrolase